MPGEVAAVEAAEVGLRVEGITDYVTVLRQQGSDVWIAASGRVKVWKLGEDKLKSTAFGVQPKQNNEVHPSITDIYDFGPIVLVGSTRGLIWCKKFEDSIEPSTGTWLHTESREIDTGVVYSIREWADSAVIGAEKGLFRISRDNYDAVAHLSQEGLSVYDILESDSALWLATNKGLYKWTKGELAPRLFYDFGDTRHPLLYEKDQTLWIAANDTLYRLSKGSETPQIVSRVDKRISAICKVDSTVWLGADDKLYLWNEHNKELIAFDGLDLRYVSVFQEIDSGIMIGSWNGLFFAEKGSKDQPKKANFTASPIHSILRIGSTVLLGTSSGLFRLNVSNENWDAGVQITSTLPSTILSDSRLTVEWKINNYEIRTAPDLVSCRIIIRDENGGIKEFNARRGDFQLSLPPLAVGKYSMVVEAADVLGRTSRSPGINFAVTRTVSSPFDWVKLLGFGYVFLNLISFVGLVFTARWSKKSFDILTDPFVRTLGLYFGFALRHSRFIRNWIFERYYREVKNKISVDHKYVPAQLYKLDGSWIKSTALLEELTEKNTAWVYGSPGVGKTEMIMQCMRDYFSYPSLAHAWQRFRFIPILIRVREITGTSLRALVRLSLERNGMFFDDSAFFDRFLKSNDFLVVLDGLNEAALDSDMQDLVAGPHSVRILVTSQSVPNYEVSKYWLPDFTEDFAKELLKSFLGPKQASQVIRVGKPTLWSDLRSGYDVKLIADLARADQVLPQGRLELYQATIDYAVTLSGSKAYPREVVCRVAWDLWKRGLHRFQADDQLTNDLVVPLQAANLIVARSGKLEFRHDLMRAYLAASWAVQHATSLNITLNRLTEQEIWNLSPSEQDLVFPFICELADIKGSLEEIAQFATNSMEQRFRLLVAAQEFAKRQGTPLNVMLE